MKFLSSITALFNSLTAPKTVDISRKQLASLVAPLMIKPSDMSNEAIALGWSEAAEWLRIGFDGESNKGTLYHALHRSLTQVAEAIRNTPENSLTVRIQEQYLRAIKSSYLQFEEAAMELNNNSNRRANTPPQVVQDRHGNSLIVPVIPIWNRPNAPHDLFAMKLQDIRNNMDDYFETSKIKPASDRQMLGMQPYKPY